MTDRTDWEDPWTEDERYQQLVELSPDCILVHDGERILLGNAAAVRLAGVSRPEELVDLPIDTFLDPPYLKSVEAQLTDPHGSPEPAAPVRDTFRRLDGTEVQVEVRALVFLDHGRPAAHLVIRDISERLAAEETARQIEERLQQSQRMEVVGALAGGVAHEVNNMMGVILGFGDFLLRDVRLPADCLADVREIIKAADRAASVTRQLLAYSRRAVLRPQAVNLAGIVEGAEPVIRKLLGDGRKLEVSSRISSQVRVDPGQVEQVLINLALNARDAMPEGGTLTVATGEVDLPSGNTAADCTLIPAGRYATLVVRDTGIGVPPDLRTKIFEPFFTTKPLGQGTGLGLAAVHGIVKQHNGCIGLTSEPGHGSTFTVFFPILDAAPPIGAPWEASAAPMPHGFGTVMVVEDEPALRGIVVRSLEEGGFRVLQAGDGAGALELIDRYGPPELVLTDVVMPGIGGAELARRLKERWPTLPVMFVSGYSHTDLGNQGTVVDEIDLIQKPFSPRELVSRVTKALTRTRDGHPAAG